MAKKSLFLILIITLVFAIILCGCGANNGGGNNGSDNGGGNNGSDNGDGSNNDKKGQLKGTIYRNGSELVLTTEVSVTFNGQTITVTDGKYAFTELPPGEGMELTAEAEGYNKYTGLVDIKAGEITTHNINLVKDTPTPVYPLEEVRALGASTFPTGVDDNVPCTDVNYCYYMAKYEVTYGLWKKVYDWATDNDRGSNRYYFQNPGAVGGGSQSLTNEHPVTQVSWRDAMVWCNALTEYYNANNDPGFALECVYILDGEIIRDSTGDDSIIACDYVSAKENAKGYRLPTCMEWELAARYQDGVNWTSGKNASGATASIDNPEATAAVAWYADNSGGSSHPVGERQGNHLGIYDLSGNVWEWCFDLVRTHISNTRGKRGGAWDHPIKSLRVGEISNSVAYMTNPAIGFRPVRTE